MLYRRLTESRAGRGYTSLLYICLPFSLHSLFLPPAFSLSFLPCFLFIPRSFPWSGLQRGGGSSLPLFLPPFSLHLLGCLVSLPHSLSAQTNGTSCAPPENTLQRERKKKRSFLHRSVIHARPPFLSHISVQAA